MTSACREISECEPLKRLLLLVLTIGNFMNAKSIKGGAHGVKIETLLKLGECWSHDKKTSLLDYLRKHAIEKA